MNCNSNAFQEIASPFVHPWYIQQQLLESTTTSDVELTQKLKSETTGQKSTDSNRVGDIAEHYVIVEALKRGAEVYKNVGCTGKTDLVIEYNGFVEKCDVKTLGQGAPGSPKTWIRSTGKSISTPIGVDPDTWEIKWHPKRTPEGLESFWD